MCTIKHLEQYFNTFFRDIGNIKGVRDIKPFYISQHNKELQYAAYKLLNVPCVEKPVQFLAHTARTFNGYNAGKTFSNWREGEYIFIYTQAIHFRIGLPNSLKGFNYLATFVVAEESLSVVSTNSIPQISNIKELKEHICIPEITPKKGNDKMAKGNKQRSNVRLVFTYTNGATYTVRGVQEAEVLNMAIHYSTKTTDSEGNILYQKAIRKITNDFETVVMELPNGGKRVLLDLRADRNKKIEKPLRKHKSREEYEAEWAQKEAEEARIAKVEELLKEAVRLSSNLGGR